MNFSRAYIVLKKEGKQTSVFQHKCCAKIGERKREKRKKKKRKLPFLAALDL